MRWLLAMLPVVAIIHLDPAQARIVGCEDPSSATDRGAVLIPCERVIGDPGAGLDRKLEARAFRARALRALGRPKEARVEVEAGLLLSPRDVALIEIRGTLRLEAGETRDAWQDAMDVIARDPNNPRRYQLAITMSLRHGNLDRAGKLIEHARNLDPDSIQLLDFKATYHLQREELAAALQTLDMLLASDNKGEREAVRSDWYGRPIPRRTRLLLERAQTLARMGDHRRAGAAFDAIVRDRADAITLAERAHFKAMRPDEGIRSYGEEALVDADAALAFDPAYHRAHHARAKVLQSLGQWRNALTAYDAAIQAFDVSFYSWERGRIRRKLGDAEGAYADVVRALEKNPIHIQPTMRDARARGYFVEADIPTSVTPAVRMALKACSRDDGCW